VRRIILIKKPYMKLALLFMLFIGTASYSQENSLVKSNEGNSTTQTRQESDSLLTIQIFNDSINYQIGLVNSHLNSIQIKWDWIMNNPEEKSLAEDEGWFDRMAAVKQELEEKKLLLLDALQ